MYCPILKAKAGELEALRRLPGAERDRVALVLDIPTTADEVGSNLDDYLHKKAARVRKAWGTRKVAVDIFDLEPSVLCGNGSHPVEWLFQCLRVAGVTAIPVGGLDREPRHYEAVRRVVAQGRRGLCVRILEDDMITPDERGQALREYLRGLNVPPEDVDLLLDFRSIRGRNLSELARFAEAFLLALPYPQSRWRTVAVSASAMPQSLAEVAAPGSEVTIERSEIDLWSLIQSRSGIQRQPIFGDYGIVHPDSVEFDPVRMNPAASIRYTVARGWLLVRGRSLRIAGFRQFHSLAQRVVARPEYMGRRFSYGDEGIALCARRQSGPGNLTKWVAFGTSHHLAMVASQLAA
jgi:hypothetical protein